MKKILLLLVCALLLMGCTTHSSISYTYNVDTGDKVTLELDTSDKYSMTSKNPFTIMHGEDEESTGMFVEASEYERYEKILETDEKSTVFKKDTKDGNKYIFWCFDNSEYNYIVLVGDSNTAVLIGNTTSRESAEECFNRLTITLEK